MENYYIIQSFMIKDLELRGTKLNIYALIYGFSRDSVGIFNGSYDYIAKAVGKSRSTVIRLLNELVQEKFIEKIENKGFNKCNSYKCNLKMINDSKKQQCQNETIHSSKMELPECQNGTMDGVKMELYKYNNKYTNKYNDKYISEKDTIFDKIYFEDNSIDNLFKEYLKTRPKNKNTERSIMMMVNKAKSLKLSIEEIREAIEKAIAGGYMAVHFNQSYKKNEDNNKNLVEAYNKILSFGGNLND